MKFIKITLLLFAAIAMVQCQKDPIQEKEIVDQEIIPEEILSKLEHMGFNTTEIPVVASEEGYIVEGDILIGADDIMNIDKTLGAKQRYASLVRCKAVRDIKIVNNLPKGIPRNALAIAIRNWNRVNGSFLKIRIVKRGSNISIEKGSKKQMKGKAGLSSIARNGRPGNIILLDTDFRLRGKALNFAQWRTVIEHEIGHTIGFKHTNSKDGRIIPGTSRLDAKSVMNMNIAGLVLNLTVNDKKALRKMYGGGPSFNLCF